MREYVIYKTTNLVNGKFYVGKSTRDRVERGYLGSGTRIKAAIRKYGRENFKTEILETYATEAEVYEAERRIVTEACCIDPNCYNIQEGGLGGTEGMVFLHKDGVSIKVFPENVNTFLEDGWFLGHTIEHNRNVSEAVKGRVKSPEHIEAIRQTIHEKLPELQELHKGMGKGDVFLEKDGHVIRVPGAEQEQWKAEGYVLWKKHYSEETRQKMSQSHKGKPGTMKGKHHSEETKRKISEAGKGRKHTDEWRQKVSAALKGHEYWGNPDALKGRTRSEESRAKQRATIAERGRVAWNKGKTGCYAGGTIWMNNGYTNRRVKLGDVEQLLQQGWVKGKVKQGIS